MNEINFDIKSLKIGREIGFTLPYLNSKLKFNGEIIKINTKTVEVRYKTCLGEQDPYKINILSTEIPFSFLILAKN